jgi:HAD superfamily hydrolase (TIGR01458 family)
VGDLGAAWSFEHMNRAFRQVLAGARLVALQRNRYWKTAGGLSLDAGPFVAALEYAAGVEATLVGKPSRAFFDIAVASLGVPASDVVMVGDDPMSDVAGAHGAGCAGVLVRTGKYRPGDDLPAGRLPDAVVDSVADLPVLFGL